MTEKRCVRCAERNVGNMKTPQINNINNFQYLLMNHTRTHSRHICRILATVLLFVLTALTIRAQKWTYDFIVPDQGSFIQAIHAANARPNKQVRYRIFVRSGNYRLRREPAAVPTLTAPHTSIVGEQWQNTQVEYCPMTESLTTTCTLFLNGADSTYIQDIELWSNYRNDLRLYANTAVALREKHCRGNILKNVSLLGTQNTYYTNEGECTYLEDCRIAGTVDFICGGGTIYFNHCDVQMVNRGDATRQDILCAPATEPGRSYGFVFNDCYIDGPEHQKGRYLLGRGWKGAPRAAFISCQMNIEPAAEGWADTPGVAPERLAEYESTNGLFELLDLTRRRQIFAATPDNIVRSASMHAEEAQLYTPDQVFPAWHPQDVAAQVVPPVLHIAGRRITWNDLPEAGCYVVCKDRKAVAFTTHHSYTVPAGTREGACFTVRCANQRGGLGLPSDQVVFSLH